MLQEILCQMLRRRWEKEKKKKKNEEKKKKKLTYQNKAVAHSEEGLEYLYRKKSVIYF